ncbi:MAG: TRAP transporter substrate-binding protein DctP [Alphaproteobacteria bacterium]|nr:TRAP transporter substrate-binding protein DctP [Alphaproteobacteria bacterium]MCW5738796.1 TRAP transporter substrate-binding protein DctP [Alphaproteobacteria bacterium]
MRSMRALAAAIALVAGVAIAQAQDLPKLQFKVVGSFGNLTSWQKIEKPFWDALPKESGGAFTASAQSITGLGLKGSEVMGLLKQDRYDFAHGLPTYVANDPWLEAVDIAGVARDLDMARKITTVWAPRLDARMDRDYNAKFLNWYAFPTQMIHCKTPIKSLADLKGRKVGVQDVSQGDLVEGLGAIAVTLPFGDGVPALLRGAVDCAIASTSATNEVGWHEVVTHVIDMPVGFSIAYTAVSKATWRGLNGKSRDFLVAQLTAFEDRAWKVVADEAAMGRACIMGAICRDGKAGKLVRVLLSPNDRKAWENVVADIVLKRWARRCGADCVAVWNDTVGRMADVTAAP